MLDLAIAKFDAKQKAAAIKNEQFVRSQRILDEIAPIAWKDFRAALKIECTKYSSHFTFEIRPNSEAIIRIINGTTLEVNYLSEAKVIAFQYGEIEGVFSIHLSEEGKASICEGENRFASAEIAAERLLAAVLG